MRNTTNTTVHAPQIADLREELENHKGNGFIHLIAKTVPAMRKTDNPYFGKVFKVQDVQAQAGFHYINSVNNQLVREGKEGNAKAKGRAWGVRMVKENGFAENTCLVTHTKKGETEARFYLEAKIERVNSVHYEDAHGVEVDKADLAPWLSGKGAKSSTQANVNAEIILRDYEVSNILWARFDGMELGAKPLAPMPATITV
jgi:hypothetical protein